MQKAGGDNATANEDAKLVQTYQECYLLILLPYYPILSTYYVGIPIVFPTYVFNLCQCLTVRGVAMWCHTVTLKYIEVY